MSVVKLVFNVTAETDFFGFRNLGPFTHEVDVGELGLWDLGRFATRVRPIVERHINDLKAELQGILKEGDT